MVINGADNKKKPEISELLRSTEQALRQRSDIENVKEHPAIATWREAHRLFGNNPNRYAPSVEAVIKRVVKGGSLPNINPLVDIYNHICMKYIVPVGGEDLDTCKGNIELAVASGEEKFIGLGDENNDSPTAGEVIYKDEEGVLCRRFNWREAD
ncbi:MAG: hypothetical protein HYZ63_02975, partial [Candidatus Andersenbacteria bacterium]|nr:hypothetical protein [Candidatus Andersenbacteria bacterium]